MWLIEKTDKQVRTRILQEKGETPSLRQQGDVTKILKFSLYPVAVDLWFFS